MKKWVSLMVGFNAIDAISTVYVVSTAVAQEHNPIVQYLYQFHPILWLAVKFSLILVGSIAVLNQKEQRTNVTFIAVTVFYGLLSLYQILVLMVYWRYN